MFQDGDLHEKTPKQETMWIISGHERNVGGGVGRDGAARDEVSWLEQFHCGGIACEQWGVIDYQEGSQQLQALKEVLVVMCRDESSEGGRWVRQETLAMD